MDEYIEMTNKRNEVIQLSKDVEDERLQKLDDLLINDKDFRCDSFGQHELLDRTFILSQTMSNFLLDHPTSIIHQEIYHKIDKVVVLLEEVYQKIANIK